MDMVLDDSMLIAEDIIEFCLELPKTKSEMIDKFGFKNNELSIDDVRFDDIKIEKDKYTLISLPKNNKEFQNRFII